MNQASSQTNIDAANAAILDYELKSASLKQAAYEARRQIAQTGNKLCNLLAGYYQNPVATMGAITAYVDCHGPDALSQQLAQDPIYFGAIDGVPPEPNHIARLVVSHNHAKECHKQAAQDLLSFQHQQGQDQECQQ